MSLEVRSFEVYGFKIEVHAGGRRVWPPSFKRFINEKMDNGELNVGEVMKTCKVSQSLVYKWRADVKASRNRIATVTDDAFALPNFRSAHVFATRQLIGWPLKAQRRANFVQVLYEISAVSAEFGAKAHGTFCKLLHKAL